MRLRSPVPDARSFLGLPPPRVRLAGRLRGAGLRARGKVPLHERLEAPDRANHPAGGPEIVRDVGQPSFIEAFERTSIYPKLTAYIDKWIVDIGDKVKKGDVLATLFVPELVEDFGTKKATVKLDEERVELARKLVEVAEADVKAAEARLVEAQAILAKYQAEVDRWDTEVKRLTHEVDRGVVDPQILNESTNQWKIERRLARRGKGDHHQGGGGTALQAGHAGEGQGRCLGRAGRPGRGHQRGEADRGMGRLPHAPRAF